MKKIGTIGPDTLQGGTGDDLLLGRGGDDSLWGGGSGLDSIYGGAGNDIIFDDDDGGDLLDGGNGIDVLSMSFITWFGGSTPHDFAFDSSGAQQTTPTGSTAVNFERLNYAGGDFADIVTGGDFADTLRGWQGDDVLAGGAGGDFIIGDNGGDALTGGAGNDTLYGNGNADSLDGGDGDDLIIGGSMADTAAGDDTIRGGLGSDILYIGPQRTVLLYDTSAEAVFVDLALGRGFGGEAQGDTFLRSGIFGTTELVGSAFDNVLIGAETMWGGAGDDRLVSTYATDLMTGGAGRDTFALNYQQGVLYDAVQILDFDQGAGEKLDLSAIVPSKHSGTFKFVGTGEFTKAGQVHYQVLDDLTLIALNTNHDPGADYIFTLAGEYTLTAADFIL